MKPFLKLLVVAISLFTAGNIWSQTYSWTTIVGLAGTNTYGCIDGTNGDARFNKPYSIAVDATGNLYVADSASNIVRKVTPVGSNWVTTTLVGLAGASGSADGTNSDARFNSPRGIAVDAMGNLYIGDMNNDTIRRAAPVGTNWVVTTIAGYALSCGNLNGTNGDARFSNPRSIAVDSATNVYIADWANCAIRKIVPVGTNWKVSAVAGSTVNICNQPNGGYVDGTNTAALFRSPTGIGVDNAGNLYVADTGNCVMREILPVGTNWVVSTLAGSGGITITNYGSADGTNSDARFTSPRAVAVDGVKNVYVADANCNIRKLTPMGTNWVVTTLGGVGGLPGNTDGVGTNALFNQPYGIAVDNAGNLYVADTFNNAIRMGRYIPLLQGILASNQLSLSWPSTAGSSGYGLQQNADLTTTNWADVGLPVSDDGTNQSVTLPAPASNLFFRLLHP